jgi:hypothetical protein
MYVLGMVIALALGVYIGLGLPGMPGREDRVLPSGMRRKRLNHFRAIDLLRRDERSSRRR